MIEQQGQSATERMTHAKDKTTNSIQAQAILFGTKYHLLRLCLKVPRSDFVSCLGLEEFEIRILGS